MIKLDSLDNKIHVEAYSANDTASAKYQKSQVNSVTWDFFIFSAQLLRHAFGGYAGLTCLGPTGCLHVTVTNKATVARSTACFSAAHCLQIAVSYKATLAATPAGCGAAIGLLVWVLNEPTLARTAR